MPFEIGHSLAVHDGKLWVGGVFDSLGGAPMHHLAAWDGSQLTPAEPRLPSDWISTHALAVHDGAIFVAGRGQDNARPVLVLENGEWQDAGNGLPSGYSGTGSGFDLDLDASGPDLRVVGQFRSISGELNDGVGVLRDRVWRPISIHGEGLGLRGTILSIPKTGAETVVCGCFGRAGDKDVSSIALLDGERWEQQFPGIQGCIFDSVPFKDGLVVVGSFLAAGPPEVRNVAFVREGRLEPFGNGWRGRIVAVAVLDSNLVVGGDLYWDDGSQGPKVALWNGVEWQSLDTNIGSGGSSGVYDLAVVDGVLYAGGYFNPSIGNVGVVRWSGSQWEPLPENLTAFTHALTEHEGQLVAGGRFAIRGTPGVHEVARWTGERWLPVGDGGLDFTNVYALASNGPVLVAGGNYEVSSLRFASRVTVWDGVSWHELEHGNRGTVRALRITDNGLWVGGSLSAAGGIASSGIAFWSENEPLASVGSLQAIRSGTDVHVSWMIEGLQNRARVWVLREEHGREPQRLNSEPFVGTGRFAFVDENAPASDIAYRIEQEVGWFTSDQSAPVVVAAFAPILVSDVTGERGAGGVQLRWNVSDPDGRASFLVWRGDPGELRTLLTEDPLHGSGEVGFFDADAPSITLHYYLDVWVDESLRETIGPVEVAAVGGRFALESAANPMTNEIRLWFAIEREGRATIELFDTGGRRVAMLLDENRAPGEHELVATLGGAIGSGVYWVRLRSGGQSRTVKLIAAR